MEHSKKMRLVDKLISLTSQGPVSGWINRIGEIAARAELPIDFINWNNSPRVVSMAIVETCSNESKLKLKFLEKVLKEVEADLTKAKDMEPEDVPPIPEHVEATVVVTVDAINKFMDVVASFDEASKAYEYINNSLDPQNKDPLFPYKENSLLHQARQGYVYNLEHIPHNPTLE